MINKVFSLLFVLAISVTTVTAKEVQVKGYTKKDGTKVEGYTKTVKDRDTTKVKAYTKKDGTVVKGYERKKKGGEGTNPGPPVAKAQGGGKGTYPGPGPAKTAGGELGGNPGPPVAKSGGDVNPGAKQQKKDK